MYLRTVADFARDQSLPPFLSEALEGELEEVRRLTTDALSFFEV